jgi:two-component system, LytTR family, response regulator
MIEAVIIDDDVMNIEQLKFKLEKHFSKQLQIAAVATSGSEGLQIIARHHPTLVFLDVEMQDMTGFEMLKQLKEINFEIIFITSFGHYAIKAIRFNALDYLLKPVDLDLLKEAVQRAILKIEMTGHTTNSSKNLNAKSPELDKLAIPTQDGLMIVSLNDIIRMEADANYTIIYLANKGKTIASKNIGEFENMLAGKNFIRVHHSYLVNLRHVTRYIKGAGGQLIMSDGSNIDVSRRKKEDLVERLRQINPA